MNRTVRAVALNVLIWAQPTSLTAQLLAARDGPIVYGHHHLNATNIEEHKQFWANTLGGTVVRVGTDSLEIIKFPNALLFMRSQPPTAGTAGGALDHIGFSVPSLRQTIDKVTESGYEVVAIHEAPPGVTAGNGPALESDGNITGTAYVLGPDNVKVELVEIREQTVPIVSHHVHFVGQQPAEMRTWYMRLFGAPPRPGETEVFMGANLPGIGLDFSRSTDAPAGTRGRALDHIGFEVKNLEEFCKGLEAKGIKLDVPYRRVAALDVAIAFVTDPWGTYIELTEGLDRVP